MMYHMDMSEDRTAQLQVAGEISEDPKTAYV